MKLSPGFYENVFETSSAVRPKVLLMLLLVTELFFKVTTTTLVVALFEVGKISCVVLVCVLHIINHLHRSTWLTCMSESNEIVVCVSSLRPPVPLVTVFQFPFNFLWRFL